MRLRGALRRPSPLGEGAKQAFRDQEEEGEAQSSLETATPAQEVAQSAIVSSQLSHALSKKTVLTRGGSSTPAQNPESSSAASSSGLTKMQHQVRLDLG